MMLGWKEYKMKEITEIKYGKMPPKGVICESGYPVFSGYGITGYSKEFHYKEKKLIIIARGVGGTGKVKFSPKKSWITNLCLILETNKDLVDDYYLCQLLNLASLKSKLDTGSAQSQITINSLNPFKLNLPPLKTQQKIATILSSYDELIENNIKRIKLLEEKALQTYKEWFVRFKFPSYETLEFDKDSGLPVGWGKNKLVESCNLVMGQSPKSEFYNNEKNGLPFHQGVKDYGFRYPTNSSWSTQGNRIAEEDSILFSVRAPVGRLNVAIEKLIIGRGLASVNHKKGWNSFLLYQLQNIFYEDNLIGGGAIYNSVTKKDVERIEIIHAKEDINIKYNDFASIIDNQIKNLTKQNQHLKKVRNILLPRLMSGVIDVEKSETLNLIYKVNEGLGMVAEENKKEKKETKASEQFKEAVLLAMHVNRYATPTFTLSTYRYTKFSYLYRRFYDNKIADYKRKAAGPYNEKYKYKGPLTIALKNKYIKQSKGKYKGFEIGENINEALNYAPNYWDNEVFTSVDKFRYKKDKELETITTIDNAILNLIEKGSLINLETIKQDIGEDDDWKHKLEQDNFSDENINKAKRELEELFKY